MKTFNLTAVIFLMFYCLQSFAVSNLEQNVVTKKHDADYMQRAIEIGEHNPKAPFGALIVDNKTGKVLAEGLNGGNKRRVKLNLHFLKPITT